MTLFFIAIKEEGKEVKPLAGTYNQAQLGKAVEAAQKQYPIDLLRRQGTFAQKGGV